MRRRRTETALTLGGWDRFRDLIRRRHTVIVLAGLFGLSAFGGTETVLPERWRWGIGAGGALWVAGSMAIRYLRRAATDRRSHIETLCLLVLGIHFLTRLTGGLYSPWAFLYIVLVLFASLHYDLPVNSFTIVAILFLEGAGLLQIASPPTEWQVRALIWAAGLSLIPLVVKAYLRAEHQEKEELRATVLRFKTSAQTFRPLPDIGQPNQIWSLNPDERDQREAPLHLQFDQAIENLFWLLKGAIPRAQHGILFLPMGPDGRFRLHRSVGGDPRELRPQCTIAAGEGLIGFAAKELRLYRMGHVNPDHHALGYVTRAVRIRSVMINPIVQHDRVEAMVLVDSLEPEAFTEEDEQILHRLSAQVRQAIENRDRQQAAQSRAQELSTLMAISEALGSRLDLRHRLETMADKVKEVIPYDHCFIFLVEPGERRAELKIVRGLDHLPPAEMPLTSISLHDGFLSFVVKRRTPLILSDLKERQRGKTVFPTGSGISLRPASFIGLPMITQDRVIGILALTSQRSHAFDDQHKEFLNALCSQAAISIADAKLNDEVARLATTDGLTGVANHRRFQERLNEEFERQAREEGTFTLVMVDVDHFKRVNDRFGHPAGDQILRQVAGVLTRTVRKIDVVARYGGEEFAVILLNIGQKEAHSLAERIRKSVEAIQPVIHGQPQKITVSLGLAVYPDDARDRQRLIECADRALYAAKHGGRNRVCLYSKIDVLQP